MVSLSGTRARPFPLSTLTSLHLALDLLQLNKDTPQVSEPEAASVPVLGEPRPSLPSQHMWHHTS